MLGMVMIVIMLFMFMLMVIVMVMMFMPMMLVLFMPFVGVSASFRFEGGLDRTKLGTQSLQRGLKTMISPNAQRRPGDFNRHVAIADRPRQPCQNLRVSGTNLDEHFGRSHHFNQPAIRQFKRIAATQVQRFRKIKQKLQAPLAHHVQPPLVPVLEIQQHAVSRLAFPMASLPHFGGAQAMRRIIGHGEAPKSTMRSSLNSWLPALTQSDFADNQTRTPRST